MELVPTGSSAPATVSAASEATSLGSVSGGASEQREGSPVPESPFPESPFPVEDDGARLLSSSSSLSGSSSWWLWAALTRRKEISPAEQASTDVADGDVGAAPHRLQQHLTVWDLLAYGVGTTVGAGIYSLLGPGTAIAGPGIVLSFATGAVSCALTGLAYSEFAARCPVAGSAYTYAYTSFGEGLAWVIGWNLTLEYSIAAAAIARAWSDHVSHLADLIRGSVAPKGAEFSGPTLPLWLHGLPLDSGGTFSISVLAALVVVLCSALMMVGVRESSTVNLVMTSLKVLVLVFVALCGAAYVNASNWTVVNNSFVPFGASSVLAGAGTVFFSFLGFDTVSSLAEEVKNPQKNVPRGIIGSLVIATSLYVAVSLVVTGMVPFPLLETAEAPFAFAFQRVGVTWASWVVSCGALIGLTTATFTSLFGQPRIFHRMAVDGLLFPLFTHVDARGIPRAGTIATGFFAATIALLFSLGALADAISVGTLCAFTIVDAGVVFLRFSTPTNQSRLVLLLLAFVALVLAGSVAFNLAAPWAVPAVLWFLSLVPFALLHRFPTPPQNMPTSFVCPFVPTVPLLGVAINLLMLGGLRADAWLRLLVWTAIGAAIYFFYGIRHSKLNPHHPSTK
jgi:basic amino acid/polyamine antiporter, APA family